VNSVSDVNITERVRAVIQVTAQTWSCSVKPTHTKASEESEPALTTEPGAHVNKKDISLKPSDPYPTWPFTQVEPKSLARWCKRNLKPVYQIEEAPF
jgi:hypothetical protein